MCIQRNPNAHGWCQKDSERDQSFHQDTETVCLPMPTCSQPTPPRTFPTHCTWLITTSCSGHNLLLILFSSLPSHSPTPMMTKWPHLTSTPCCMATAHAWCPRLFFSPSGGCKASGYSLPHHFLALLDAWGCLQWLVHKHGLRDGVGPS